jgi:hypothetical protein
MVLPFAAGRDVESTFLLVPLYSCWTALVALFKALLELAPAVPDEKTIAVGASTNAMLSGTVRRMLLHNPVIATPKKTVFHRNTLATLRR